MNTDTSPATGSEIKIQLPVMTIDKAKAAMQLALTKANLNIQLMLTELGKLVLNEDNIPVIKEKLTSVEKITKEIEGAFEIGKKPYWDACKAYDNAKKELISLYTDEYNRVNRKHTQLCQDVEATNRKNEAEEKRKKNIQDGINNNINSFSQRIADCTTNEQLIEIERIINLEKARKEKYGEFYEDMVKRLGELTPLLTEQKNAIKELVKLDKKADEAVLSGDDEALLGILDKKEEITAKVHENKIKVQETAVNQSSGYSGCYGGGFKTVPTPGKAARRSWKTELVKPEIAVKFDLTLLRIELNPVTVKAELDRLQQGGVLKEGGIEDHTVNGIRFYLSKKY